MSRTHSLTHNIKFSSVDHVSVIVDRFEHSLRFCHLEFHKEAISLMFQEVKMAGIFVAELLWFCGPCFQLKAFSQSKNL